MNLLYPLKFAPLFKDKIWGGQKARTLFGLDFSPLPNCGEVWALSGYNGNESIVSNGFLQGNNLTEIIEIYMEDLLGDKVFEAFGHEFPLLIKVLDSNDWLSIQVHPDDELAAKRHDGSGKTEMWYVIDAEPEAELISGFRSTITKQQYLDKLNGKALSSLLNYEKAAAGDVFYVPAGRVHALGPGLFIAEIQQSSDLTYRIYDFDRTDAAGNARELHTELALDALDFEYHSDIRTQYTPVLNQTVPLVQSPYFETGLLHFGTTIVKNYSDLDSFVILFCVAGKCSVQYPGGTESLKAGEVVLIPASLEDNIALVPTVETKILEIYIP
jgi:mannose-6-phosphate isomerase